MNLYGYKGKKDGILIDENEFLIDGYSVGDRILEGVMFKIKFKDVDVLSVEVREEHKKYFNQLNAELWLGRVKKEAERLLRTGDEVEISEEIKEKYNVEGAYIALMP